jgi:hypothetical protein
MIEKTVLWLVGQDLGKPETPESERVPWDFQGIFDSEEKAVAACIDRSYFVMPVVLNEGLPRESIPAPGAYFPWVRNADVETPESNEAD